MSVIISSRLRAFTSYLYSTAFFTFLFGQRMFPFLLSRRDRERTYVSMNPKIFFLLAAVAATMLALAISRPSGRSPPPILSSQHDNLVVPKSLLLSTTATVVESAAQNSSVTSNDGHHAVASGGNAPLLASPSQTFAAMTELLRHPSLSTSDATLLVCVVGPPSVTVKWSKLLPPSSIFMTFPSKSTNATRTIHNARFSVIPGTIPAALWAYFGKYPQRRCSISIIELDDTNAAAGSGMPLGNSTTKAVGLLRSVSREPHLILFSSGSASPNASSVHPVDAALLESARRRYVRSDVAHTLDMNGGAGLYHARVFAKQHPLPSENLEHLLTSSTWASVDLRALNVLAKAIYRTVRNKAAGLMANVEGNSAQLQLERKVYTVLAQLPEVRTICEIGFNMGHSASLWLLANPTAKVYMFDLWSHEYSPIAEQFLRSSRATKFALQNVSSRLTIIKGSSLDTVPAFARKRPDVKCDIVSVDGGHTYELGLQDIENMRALANPAFHILLVDDTNCDAGWCVDEPCFEHERRGNVVNLLRISEFNGLRGISVFQYTSSNTTVVSYNK
jgi:hypothetical protein